MTKCDSQEDRLKDNTGASGSQAEGVKIKTESDHGRMHRSWEGLRALRVSLPGPAWTLGPEIIVQGRKVGEGVARTYPGDLERGPQCRANLNPTCVQV